MVSKIQYNEMPGGFLAEVSFDAFSELISKKEKKKKAPSSFERIEKYFRHSL